MLTKIVKRMITMCFPLLKKYRKQVVRELVFDNLEAIMKLVNNIPELLNIARYYYIDNKIYTPKATTKLIFTMEMPTLRKNRVIVGNVLDQLEVSKAVNKWKIDNSVDITSLKYVNYLKIYVIMILISLSSCKPNNKISVLPVAQTLRSVSPFPFGAALDPYRLSSDSAYRRVAGAEFNSITSENNLKMGLVHPAENLYVWTGSDTLLDFAERNNQRMHGHTLIWHHSVPDWVTNFNGDSTAWEHLFKEHIQTVVSHYSSRVASWDVVNEAFDDDGKLLPTIWLQHLGPDYIARAFQYARDANPDVKLFYNDFGQEYNLKRLAANVAMVIDFRRRGIPIDGIGLELHTGIFQSDSSIQNAIKEVAETGLMVHLSELEVRVNQMNLTDYVFTDEDANKQKAKFKAIIEAYINLVPATQRHGITTWNVGDADSYISAACKCPDFPLPFDRLYRRKSAYDGIIDGLR